MKLLFYILTGLIAGIAVSCSPDYYPKEYRFDKNGLVYYKDTNRLFTGVVSDSSSVILLYDVVNGKKNGSFLVYYLNGKLAQSGYIIDNQNVGEWKYYYQNGNLESRGLFKNDLPDGEWEFFYANGKLKEKGTFINGLRENDWYEFNEKGKLKNIYLFKKGILINLQIRIS